VSWLETVHRRRPRSGSRAAATLIVQGQKAGTLAAGDPGRLGLLLVATMQGIAALVTSGGAPAGQVDALITDAVALFTRDQR
jgi:hypothetical protein